MHQILTHRWRSRVCLVACLFFVTACESELPPLDLPAGCNPLLAGTDCMLPFPSDFFLVDDATLPSGKRIEVTGAAVVTSIDDESANVYEVETVDGFSLTPPIVAILGEPLSQFGLNTIFDQPAKTTQTTHPTLLVNTKTLELIPHFVDLDPRATSPDRQAMVIRPLVGLEEQTRYVVLLHGVQRLDGGTAQAPEGFRRIRDRQTRGDSNLEPLAKWYAKSIFPLVEELSLKREEIQLAWDFTTGSIEHVQQDMLDMRRLILSTIEEAPPVVEIQSVDIHEEGNAWKTIKGSVTAPLILKSGAPGSEAFRNASGRIALNGDIQVPFIAIIPRSVMNDSLPANIMQYGHGFFGTRSETNSALTLAHEAKSIVFGVDWWGLSQSDTGASIANLGGDVKNALRFSKRLYQAMGNWLTLSEAIRTTLKQEEVFRRPGGELIYDSNDMTFVGMSLGAILGGTYTALNPSISKSILHVGGVALAHMMFRSDPFSPFLFVLDMSVPDALDQQKFVASLQPICDRFDPSTYAPFLVNKSLPIEQLPPSRDRQVFMQIALADTQVPNFASFLYGRLAGIPLVQPSPIEIFGMETVSGPHEGSGMVVIDLGEDPSFALKAEPPGPLNNVHTALRGREDALRQMLTFLEDGVIEVE